MPEVTLAIAYENCSTIDIIDQHGELLGEVDLDLLIKSKLKKMSLVSVSHLVTPRLSWSSRRMRPHCPQQTPKASANNNAVSSNASSTGTTA